MENEFFQPIHLPYFFDALFLDNSKLQIDDYKQIFYLNFLHHIQVTLGILLHNILFTEMRGKINPTVRGPYKLITGALSKRC